MKAIVYVIPKLILIYMLQSCSAQVDTSLIPNAIKKHATTFLDDERISSVSVSVYANGKSHSHHFGELDKGSGNSPTDTTLYEIASVTKTMTGYVVAKAISEEKLKLTDPMTKFLGEAYTNLTFEGNPITIQHLLTHTSGLPLNISGVDALHAQATKEACTQAQQLLAKYTKEEFLTALKSIQIQQQPGTAYAYSNLAPNILAYILEKVYEKPFEEILQQKLFMPLNMQHTAINLSKTQQPLLANGYNDIGEVMPNYRKPVQLWGAAGRVKSTPKDLLQYMKFQLQDHSAVKISHTKLFQDTDTIWIGYFWEIVDTDNGTRIEHHGGLYGTQNWMLIYPELNLGISIITNASFPETSQLLKTTATQIINDIIH
ncbi:MAG: serine hydrolase domain-containing protein [Bacteroidota bacterium]